MKDKKTHNIICVAICVVSGVVALWLSYMPRKVPYSQCSEVYRRYSEVEGIRATYVKDYRLNDTLTIGVTLLEAETDSGWVRLQEDFDLPVIPKEYEKRFVGDSNRVSVKNCPKSVPLYSDGDTLKTDLIVISRYKRTICHFEIYNEAQEKAILYRQLKDNTKKNHHEKNN